MNFVDIHAHVLPALDDGPQSVEGALALLKRAAASGTTTIAATPHMFQSNLGTDDPAVVRDAFSSLQAALKEAAKQDPDLAKIDLHLGAENYLGTAFLEAAEEGRVIPLGESRTLLVEIWPLTVVHALRGAVDRLLNLGYTPLLAHVERYACLHEHPDTLENLVALGCIAQVNAGALLRRHGGRMARHAQRWLGEGLISVVASDMHNLTTRPPELYQVDSLLTNRFSPHTAELCLRSNPRAVLEGRTLRLPEKRQRSWWSRVVD